MRWPDPIGARLARASQDPFQLLQLAVAAILLGGTVVALLLWATGVAPRALALAAVLWVIYGALSALWVGILRAFPEGLARMLQDVGLERVRGFSDIETLVERGHLTLAADRYAERARTPSARVEATLRRAELLTGALQAPALAVAELEALRNAELDPADDRRIGRRLAEIHVAEGNPGEAMVELRRMLDLHPGAPENGALREWLGRLKE